MAALRDSLSPFMRCSPSIVVLSPRGVSRKWEPTCGTPSIPCKTPPTSPMAVEEAGAAAIASELKRVKFTEEVQRERSCVVYYLLAAAAATYCMFTSVLRVYKEAHLISAVRRTNLSLSFLCDAASVPAGSGLCSLLTSPSCCIPVRSGR